MTNLGIVQTALAPEVWDHYFVNAQLREILLLILLLSIEKVLEEMTNFTKSSNSRHSYINTA